MWIPSGMYFKIFLLLWGRSWQYSGRSLSMGLVSVDLTFADADPINGGPQRTLENLSSMTGRHFWFASKSKVPFSGIQSGGLLRRPGGMSNLRRSGHSPQVRLLWYHVDPLWIQLSTVSPNFLCWLLVNYFIRFIFFVWLWDLESSKIQSSGTSFALFQWYFFQSQLDSFDSWFLGEITVTFFFHLTIHTVLSTFILFFHM